MTLRILWNCSNPSDEQVFVKLFLYSCIVGVRPGEDRLQVTQGCEDQTICAEQSAPPQVLPHSVYRVAEDKPLLQDEPLNFIQSEEDKSSAEGAWTEERLLPAALHSPRSSCREEDGRLLSVLRQDQVAVFRYFDKITSGEPKLVKPEHTRSGRIRETETLASPLGHVMPVPTSIPHALNILWCGHWAGCASRLSD
ncbi:uncharacterized protein BO95DRAFT_433245 [Aspergillus brunneoviolaceus CBS 621.78]|uniref:Uncharacterized protein n=1 Tax=Aspergillus brunneoviolaceus CBS 621.78 TaxID=1450534 RepID=A0ACD1G504_9EURO|nr:hypothetical protein BO95DRAFT_433245 [Aspergillus brunneoviolaceus CBS 621.78]RAH44238.1 hypothetical protein BO95DRAFT_433245 [Aspergillus brunneoviolaceus CBS 621.78]